MNVHGGHDGTPSDMARRLPWHAFAAALLAALATIDLGASTGAGAPGRLVLTALVRHQAVSRLEPKSHSAPRLGVAEPPRPDRTCFFFLLFRRCEAVVSHGAFAARHTSVRT
jgi:hypothetical protein